MLHKDPHHILDTEDLTEPRTRQKRNFSIVWARERDIKHKFALSCLMGSAPWLFKRKKLSFFSNIVAGACISGHNGSYEFKLEIFNVDLALGIVTAQNNTNLLSREELVLFEYDVGLGVGDTQTHEPAYLLLELPSEQYLGMTPKTLIDLDFSGASIQGDRLCVSILGLFINTVIFKVIRSHIGSHSILNEKFFVFGL